MKNTMNIPIRTLSIVGLIAGLAAPAQAANLILDGDFSSGLVTGDDGSFLLSSDVDEGWKKNSGGAWQTIGGAASMNNTKNMIQLVSIDTEGTGLKLSFDWAPTTGNSADLQFFLSGRSEVKLDGNLRVRNYGNGNPVNVSGTTYDFVSGGSIGSSPNYYSATGIVGSTTTITVEFDLPITGVTNLSQLNYLELGFLSNGNGAGTVDNVLLTAIPEPSSYALLAGCFGLTWVMLRRRR
jgi:hypothetical protein